MCLFRQLDEIFIDQCEIELLHWNSYIFTEMNSTKQIFTLIVVFIFFLISCGTSQSVERKKTMDPQLPNGHQIIDAQIVEISYVLKNAKVSSMTELYVRRNIQDYYIKFCSSEVSKKEMEHEMTMIDGVSAPLKLEVEFRDGLWDSCDPEEITQSRTGPYIVIHKIIRD